MAAKKNNNGGVLRDLVTAESMLQLALAVPAGCLVGWLAGTALDSYLHSNWAAVTGIILGAIGGFVQIFRVASQYLRRSDQ